MTSQNPSETYDSFYYEQACGRPYKRDEHWLSFFDKITDRIVQEINPQTVLDAGCAMGFLVEALRKKGVDAYGMDISEYAVSQVHDAIKDYCWVGSITDPLPQSYDLIVCIEVLEHLEKDASEDAVSNLTNHSDDILFSSTPFDYKEITHHNVLPIEGWVRLFGKENFVRDVDFDASFITPWAIRFRKTDEPVHQILADYERWYWLKHKESSDLRELNRELRSMLEHYDEMKDRVQALNGQLEEIYASNSWKWAQRIVSLKQKLTGS